MRMVIVGIALIVSGCGEWTYRCTVDAKKEYQTCVTTHTDTPACIGSCKAK